MSTGSISPLTNGYLQSTVSSTYQVSSSISTTTTSSISSQSDQSHLSPLAKLLSTLQQLQQTDPAKYQQVTAQIATNLSKAAQTAQSDGNSQAAANLTKLASDFTDASQTSQFPNIQDLAQAIGGGHHHHHQAAAPADTSQSSSLDPLTIIKDTLASAGIKTA